MGAKKKKQWERAQGKTEEEWKKSEEFYTKMERRKRAVAENMFSVKRRF